LKNLIYILLFGLGFGAGVVYKSNFAPEDTTKASSVSKTEEISKSKASAEIPDYVLKTLAYVRENKKAPTGYVGGRTFKNLERLLPLTGSDGQKIKYQEWDVHPKLQGQNRGAERLVTAQTGEAYYTKDHYNSFINIP
jgi:ribonuclease T1